jgi:hypothetical protein
VGRHVEDQDVLGIHVTLNVRLEVFQAGGGFQQFIADDGVDGLAFQGGKGFRILVRKEERRRRREVVFDLHDLELRRRDGVIRD